MSENKAPDFSTFEKFKEVLSEELNYYLEYRKGVEGYNQANDQEGYIKDLEELYNVYPHYYEALILIMDQLGYDIDNLSDDDMNELYTLYAVMYFNLADEIRYLSYTIQQGLKEEIRYVDVLSHLDQQDLVLMQLNNMVKGYDKDLVGDVSHALIMKAIRQVIGDSGSLLEED